MVTTADAFVKNKHEPATFHDNYVYRQTVALIGDLYFFCLEQDEGRFLAFELFLDAKNQQTKIVSQLLISLFMNNLRPFKYEARTKWKKWRAKSEFIPDFAFHCSHLRDAREVFLAEDRVTFEPGGDTFLQSKFYGRKRVERLSKEVGATE